MGKVKVYAINLFTPNSVDDSGDAILIECNGKFGMIDAGASSSASVAAEYGDKTIDEITAVDSNKVIPFLRSKGVVQLEWFIQTHFHSDHAWFSNQVIGNFKPKVVYGLNPFTLGRELAPVEYSRAANKFYFTDGFIKLVQDTLNQHGIPMIHPFEGQQIQLDEATFTFYNTTYEAYPAYHDYNNASLVTIMTHGSKRVAFMSDSVQTTMNAIVDKMGGPVDLAFAPHHGVIGNTSDKIVDTLKPKTLFITKWRNFFRSSSAGMFQLAGAEIYRMPSDSATPLSFESDGSSITVLSGTKGQVTFDWVLSHGNWYYLGMYGTPAKKWQQINYAWYYFNDSDGVMKKGWFQDTDTNWYYLSPQSVQSYYKDKTFKEGQMHFDNWIQGADGWYWLKSNGKMARSETVLINGKNYNFDSRGVCLNP